MKKHVFAIFFTLVFGLSVYGQVDTPVDFKDGRFTVVPPTGFDKFQLSKQTEPSVSGDITHYTYDMSLERGYCSITYFELPNIVESDRIKRVLDAGRDGAIKAVNATLDAQETLTIDGYPALSFTAHATDANKIVSYVHTVEIVANSRLYAFLFVAPSQAELDKPDIQKFFSSIHIQK